MENGSNWTALAIVFLKEIMPELLDDIEFDSGFSMFCAYSSNREVLTEFALNFKEICEDEEVFKILLNRAQITYIDEMTHYMVEKLVRENMSYAKFRGIYAEKYMARLEK
jgi:FMN-dependent NADH-azoreductase